MDYPLTENELEEIEKCISSLDKSICDSGRLQAEFINPFCIDFLLKYQYAKDISIGTGPLSEWANTIVLTHSADSTLKEIKMCNQKAKEANWHDWNIAIVSAVIGGIFGLIGSLILG